MSKRWIFTNMDASVFGFLLSTMWRLLFSPETAKRPRCRVAKAE
jgi:hypothetical protein